MSEDGFEASLFELALYHRSGIGIREGADSHFVETVVAAFEDESREIVSLKRFRQCIRVTFVRHRAHLKNETWNIQGNCGG